ncbi:RNA polymerase sigma factor [Kribbella deserti]|uniref:RNA polymerase sigma factor n=1 Tax=Kribbella deserti TaxID=1926257 RepID=A0ABV6QFI6_9ACTN
MTGFEDWYRCEFPGLLLFARRIGASSQESFDLAQEAVAKAYPRWAAIDEPRAYLRVAIRNGYFAQQREARRQLLGGLDVWEVPVDGGMRQVEFQDQEVVIMAAIRRLPAQQREVMAWTVDGFKPAEIASLLGRSAGTVRVNLYHARTALKRSLACLGGDDDA